MIPHGHPPLPTVSAPGRKGRRKRMSRIVMNAPMNVQKQFAHALPRRALLAIACLALALAATAEAGPREQAKRLHDRLAGVPPTEQVLAGMEADILAGNPVAAAETAMENSAFYNVTLKNFVTPWTNEEQTVFEPLNDYTATVIGMIRDDVPFALVLSGDIAYTGANNLVSPNYQQTSNDHYEALEAAGIDLSDETLLVRREQSRLPGSQLSSSDAAGVITTRQAAKAFFSAGTNRAMWRFTSINFLCRDLEQMNDITRPGDRIRQDVTRSPGGDSEIFLNTCFGCHSGLDALAGAYAYYDWDEDLLNGNTFPFGFATTDNSWINYWREGQNATLGWRGTTDRGFGAKSLGAEIASSRAFSICQVEKVFEHVCFRPPKSQSDRDAIETIADEFEADGLYRMKGVFA